MTEKKLPNIYQRISAIQKDVTAVAKDANVDNRYQAVTHDAVTRMLRPLMVKHGVISLVSFPGGVEYVDTGVSYRNSPRHVIQLRAQVYVQYINIDNPDDNVGVWVNAAADDTGDKGPGKLSSYAQKFSDVRTFRIPTGEDDEQRIDETKLAEPTLTEEHVLAVWEEAEKLFDDPEAVLSSMAKNVFQVEGYHQILDKHFEVAMRKLKNKAASEK